MWINIFGDDSSDWLKKVVAKRREVVDDNSLFRLHTVFTPIMLMFCSGVLTLEYIGVGTSAIACLIDEKDDDNFVSFVNTYCWITKTYTVVSTRNGSGSEAAPGVGPGEPDRYYVYYQWVTIALFLQGMMCYVPKYLWKSWEGGFLKELVDGLSVKLETKDVQEKRDQVISYLAAQRNNFSRYMVRYWICEALCLANILFQFDFMNRFLNGRFFRYGLDFLSYHRLDQEDRHDPMIALFPQVAKCHLNTFGPSGTLQMTDIMCILPLNVVNEKTYIFVWFWYSFLLAAFCLLVVYRLLLCCCPGLRRRLLIARDSRVTFPATVACRMGNMGDWWVLYMLSKNVDPSNFRDIIEGVTKCG